MDRNQISKAKKMEADVVVMGAGGCGMAASIAAAENGAKVILLDKKNGGGNSAMAWGLLAADSPFQKLMSISCTTDQVYKAAMEMFHYRVNARIWRAFVDKSGDTIRWLTDMGVNFTDAPHMWPGQPLRTWHATALTGMSKMAGPVIVKALRKKCEDVGVRLLTQSPVKKIVTDRKGGVTGIMAQTKEGELKVTAKSVIIATGGCGGNRELLKKYFPTYSENMGYAGFPHVTGDGLLMAMDIGAATEGLGTFMYCWGVNPVAEHADFAAMQPYAVYVNKKGERYIQESLTFRCSQIANALDVQPGKCMYSLFDEKCKQRLIKEGGTIQGPLHGGILTGFKPTKLEKQIQSEVDRGKIVVADSWDKIAKWMGIAPKVLKTTIEEYNSFCDQGYDPIFNKDRRFLQALRTPPYYAVHRDLGFLTTVGGIKINHHMEVLNNEDAPIPGLYAGGDTTGGWEEPPNYNKDLSGSAFGFALNSGRIAGENATKYALGK